MLLCQSLPALIDRWCHKASLFSPPHLSPLLSLSSSLFLSSHHSLRRASLSTVSSFLTKHPSDDCLWSGDSAFCPSRMKWCREREGESKGTGRAESREQRERERVKCCLYHSIEEEEILLLDLSSRASLCYSIRWRDAQCRRWFKWSPEASPPLSCMSLCPSLHTLSTHSPHTQP